MAVASTIIMTNTQTLTGTTTFNNLIFNTNTPTNSKLFTLTGVTVTTTGKLTFSNSSTGTMGLFGGTLVAMGDILWNGAPTTSFTTQFIIGGTGNQTLVGQNFTTTSGSFVNVTINKPSGILVLPPILRTGSNWTYIQGTLDTATNNTNIVFMSGNTITGSHALNNVTFNQNSTTNITYTISSSSTLTVTGTLIIDDGSTGTIKINTGTLVAQGDIIIDQNNAIAGSAGLIISGQNNQLLTILNGQTNHSNILNTTVNKSGGLLTIKGFFSSQFVYTSGNVDWTTYGATLSLGDIVSFTPGPITYGNIYIRATSTVTLGGTISLAGDWTNNGGLITGANGVSFVGIGTSTVISGGTATNKDFQDFTVNKTGNGVVQLSSYGLDVDGTLNVISGVLNLNGQSVSTVATCNNGGTIRLLGDETISCIPTNVTGSTVEYIATSSTRAIKNWQYYNLVISGSGGTFTDSGNRTLFGNFSIIAGTYLAPTTLNIAGNFFNSGLFTHNSGTVIFNGSNQALTGAVIWYNLTKSVTSTSTFTFDNTATQTIVGILTLSGVPNNRLILHSDVIGLQWEIDPQGLRAINYVDVKDSNNINATTIANNNSINSGNNTNWAPSVNAPTVAMSAPANNSIISGTITISATASDDAGVAGVQFKLDGADIGAEDITSPYSVLLDSTTATEGSHVFVAVARNINSIVATSTGVTVTVDNATSSLSQYGITWTFNSEYQYGQYVNGDYWVVGPITINSITPNVTTGRNGWEINPQSHTNQPYDDRAYDYSSSSLPILPAVVSVGSSVVKTVSAAASSTQTFVQTAAILTVLSSIPTDRGTTLFRPPYFGTIKPSYSINSMNLGVLPSLAPVASTPTLNTVASNFQKVQLDHKEGWTGRSIHPIDNMPDYGADISNNIAVGVLRLELNDSVLDKRQAGIMMTQAGIDWYQMTTSGQNWSADGGHNLGRKLGILFAGIVLNNQSMKDIVSGGVDGTYQENGQIKAYPQANGGNGMALWGQPNTELQYWTELANPGTGSKVIRDPYGYIDGSYDPGDQVYQFLTALPYKNLSVAARLLPNGPVTWNDPEFFAYVERWVTSGTWVLPDPCAPYDGSFSNYGVTFGPNGSGGCILDNNSSNGIGRFPLRHGLYVNGGNYASTFASNMYSSYSSTVDVSPPIVISTSAGTPGQTSATITWFTNEGATSQVEYGATNIYGATTTLNSSLVTNHSINLTSLIPNTTYHYRVLSKDASLNSTVSIDSFFVTATDTTPPSVPTGITSVATSASTINLAWTGSTDNSGMVSGYQIFRNGTFIATSTINSFSDTGLSASVGYLYAITAFDLSVNISASSDSFSVTTSATPSSGGGGSTWVPIVMKTPTTVATSSASVPIIFPVSAVLTRSVPTLSFPRRLIFGMAGDDVLLLQKALNTLGYTVSPTGSGSKGRETFYYGKKTQIAVQKFQCKELNICRGNYFTTGYGRFGNLTKLRLLGTLEKLSR